MSSLYRINLRSLSLMSTWLSLAITLSLTVHSYYQFEHHVKYSFEAVRVWSNGHTHHDLDIMSSDSEHHHFNYGHEHYGLTEGVELTNVRTKLTAHTALTLRFPFPDLKPLDKPPKYS